MMTPEFHELVVEAPYPVIKAFLTGFFLEREPKGVILFSREAGIDRQTLGERLKELFGGHGGLTHLVVEEDLVPVLRGALGKVRGALDFEIVSDLPVRESAFGFSFQAYARGYAREIREVLDEMPAGVRLEGYEPKEEVDPGAAGVEAYTPVHEYSLSGEGRVVGPLAEVLGLHGRLAELTLVKLEPIELTLG